MLKHRYVRLVFGISLVIVGLLCYQYAYSLWWFVLCVLVFLGLTAWGTFDIRLGYFTAVRYKKSDAITPIIALTFDDGPTPYTAEVLDLLKKYNAKATFFCIGKQVEAYPELAKRIIQEGHLIGNHTFNHSTKTGFFSVRQLKRELEMTNDCLADKIGQRPKLFRPPFGVTNPSVASVVKYMAMDTVGWSIRSLDTVMGDPARVYKRVTSRLRPGDIVLMHDTSALTVSVLNELLKFLQHHQFQLLTVDSLLNIKGYED
jgi:peptidoglycan/xylan/chitin deacetylase (PgdA/CDA1 family)